MKEIIIVIITIFIFFMFAIICANVYKSTNLEISFIY